ncbi:ATP12 family chaperone protein [Aliiroseovarius sp. PTFE2010]|uniref:ATP12 family chaperone protein n=1 Tax=Aliiroseovarius sp. PTFE2010 TaxID=3417190 RepID=UPI003CEE567E
MTEWAARRFWKSTAVEKRDDGFEVLLDGRPVRTPAKAALALPSRQLAAAIAAEWDAQDETIDPTGMPYTRMANSAIDKVLPQHTQVADMLAAYGDSDLLCYRAENPQELVARQAQAWDPLLDWAAQTFAARLLPRTGVMHAPQDAASLDALARQVHAMSPFELAAFHDLVAISGSLVVGLAAIHEMAAPEALWEASRLDEAWQEEQWGVDEEAAELSAYKRDAFMVALSFYQMVQTKF